MAETSATLKNLNDADVVVPIIPCLIQNKKPDRPWRMTMDYCKLSQTVTSMQLLCQMWCFCKGRLAPCRVRGVQPLIWLMCSLPSLSTRGSEAVPIQVKWAAVYTQSCPQD